MKYFLAKSKKKNKIVDKKISLRIILEEQGIMFKRSIQ